MIGLRLDQRRGDVVRKELPLRKANTYNLVTVSVPQTNKIRHFLQGISLFYVLLTRIKECIVLFIALCVKLHV